MPDASRAPKTRRQIAAEATHQTIVQAASRLFVGRGYHAVSIAEIAAQAGVSVQTIYNSIGSKRELLSAVLDLKAAGERSPVPVPEFLQQQTEAEPDPQRVIALLVEFWLGALQRTAPIFSVIRQAAALDPQIADLERARAAQRLANYRRAGQLFSDRGVLRPGLSIDAAAATIFVIAHPEPYRSLVQDGDWTPQQWGAWARTSLTATLLA